MIMIYIKALFVCKFGKIRTRERVREVSVLRLNFVPKILTESEVDIDNLKAGLKLLLYANSRNVFNIYLFYVCVYPRLANILYTIKGIVVLFMYAKELEKCCNIFRILYCADDVNKILKNKHIWIL